VLDKPVYYQEDCPIRLLIVTCIKNYSDYRIKSIKVQIVEKITYSANDNVLTEQKILFKQTYRSMRISGHQQWEGKLLADLPTEYRNLTITRSMGATRISCSQMIYITVLKDTPLVVNHVYLELPLTITSKPRSTVEDKKQLISLRKDTVVTTPDSPVVRSRDRSPEDIPINPEISSQKINFPNSSEEAKPVPNLLVEFHSPIPKRKITPGQTGIMSGYTTIYNPWNPATYPTVTYNNPFTEPAQNASGVGLEASATYPTITFNNPFTEQSQNAVRVGPTDGMQGAYPKNPFFVILVLQ